MGGLYFMYQEIGNKFEMCLSAFLYFFTIIKTKTQDQGTKPSVTKNTIYIREFLGHFGPMSLVERFQQIYTNENEVDN